MLCPRYSRVLESKAIVTFFYFRSNSARCSIHQNLNDKLIVWWSSHSFVSLFLGSTVQMDSTKVFRSVATVVCFLYYFFIIFLFIILAMLKSSKNDDTIIIIITSGPDALFLYIMVSSEHSLDFNISGFAIFLCIVLIPKSWVAIICLSCCESVLQSIHSIFEVFFFFYCECCSFYSVHLVDELIIWSVKSTKPSVQLTLKEQINKFFLPLRVHHSFLRFTLRTVEKILIKCIIKLNRKNNLSMINLCSLPS